MRKGGEERGGGERREEEEATQMMVSAKIIILFMSCLVSTCTVQLMVPFFRRGGRGLASFLGSPRTRTKSGKEWRVPGKIYHVRNIIGRENLIACGRTNSPTLY